MITHFQHAIADGEAVANAGRGAVRSFNGDVFAEEAGKGLDPLVGPKAVVILEIDIYGLVHAAMVAPVGNDIARNAVAGDGDRAGYGLLIDARERAGAGDVARRADIDAEETGHAHFSRLAK